MYIYGLIIFVIFMIKRKVRNSNIYIYPYITRVYCKTRVLNYYIYKHQNKLTQIVHFMSNFRKLACSIYSSFIVCPMLAAVQSNFDSSHRSFFPSVYSNKHQTMNIYKGVLSYHRNPIFPPPLPSYS